MSEPLWERMLLSATGPVVTALLAVVVLNVVAGLAQRRRDASDTRDRLAGELSEAANSLYLALQAFWRSARDTPLAERARSPNLLNQREKLEAVYNDARSRGQLLEQQLKIYYVSPEPSQCWHRVMDLLTAHDGSGAAKAPQIVRPITR